MGSEMTDTKTLDQERRELWERVKARFNAWYHAHNFDMVETFGPGWTPKYAEQMAWILMTAPPEGLRFCSLRLIPANVDQPEGPRWHASFTATMGCRSHPDAACAVILAALAAAGEVARLAKEASHTQKSYSDLNHMIAAAQQPAQPEQGEGE